MLSINKSPNPNSIVSFAPGVHQLVVRGKSRAANKRGAEASDRARGGVRGQEPAGPGHRERGGVPARQLQVLAQVLHHAAAVRPRRAPPSRPLRRPRAREPRHADPQGRPQRLQRGRRERVRRRLATRGRAHLARAPRDPRGRRAERGNLAIRDLKLSETVALRSSEVLVLVASTIQ